MIAHRGGPAFDFIGGHLVLDFNNTAAWPRGRPANNRIAVPGALILWAAEAKLISYTESIKLRRRLRTKYESARHELTEAHRFREVLHEILIAAERKRQPPSDVLAEFNQHLRKAGKAMNPEWRDGHLEWIPASAKNLPSIVERIAWRAGEFFASADFDRLRCCANPKCGWFFIDRSRNNSRRWCKMRECGDRAKSKRYYEKRTKPFLGTKLDGNIPVDVPSYRSGGYGKAEPQGQTGCDSRNRRCGRNRAEGAAQGARCSRS
ncbi:MAG: CGNR zinc finger domain-containing protein [Gemmatimonadaceae bacterium]